MPLVFLTRRGVYTRVREPRWTQSPESLCAVTVMRPHAHHDRTVLCHNKRFGVGLQVQTDTTLAQYPIWLGVEVRMAKRSLMPEACPS